MSTLHCIHQPIQAGDTHSDLIILTVIHLCCRLITLWVMLLYNHTKKFKALLKLIKMRKILKFVANFPVN